MANNEKIGAKKAAEMQEKGNAVTRSLAFFNKYQNIIYGVLIALLLLACAYIALNRFYIQKKNQEASALIEAPVNRLMAGDSASLRLALEGDDEDEGFLSIAEGYKITRTANSARYYAGLCCLKLGQKDEALEYLKKFKHREDVIWYECQALVGDLYDEAGDEAAAVRYYKKAAKGKDPFITPVTLFKLAQMYERQDKWKEALKAYQSIERDFYAEYGKMNVSQYAERAKTKAL